MAKGISPFAKIHFAGERPTQSAACASSGHHSLRLRWTVFLNSLLVLRGRLKLISTLCRAGSKLVFQLPANQGSFLPASMHLLSCRLFNQCARRRPTRLWTRDNPRRWRVDLYRSSLAGRVGEKVLASHAVRGRHLVRTRRDVHKLMNIL